MTRAILLVLAVVMLALSAPAPRIQILRQTSVAWEDEPILIVVRVEPNPANRAFVVSAVDDGEVVRSSLTELDETSERTFWMRWGRLPAGELLIVAVLYGDSGPVARDSKPMRVLARWEP